MSEPLRRQARTVIAEELDAERDAEGRIHLTETHVRFGAAALGSAAAGLTALQLGAVGYAVAQQGPGAGSYGTEAHPLEEIFADTVDRQTDEIRTDALSVAGNEFVLDADATVANEASNVRVRSDAIEIADGSTWNPAMAEWYDGSAWGGVVVDQYRNGRWTQLYPETAVPDSVLYQFQTGDITASFGSVADPWPESRQGDDMSVTGATYEQDLFGAGYHGVSSDGTDDEGTTSTMETFGSDMDTDFAIAIGLSTTDQGRMLGAGNSSDGTFLSVGNDGAEASTAGPLEFRIRGSAAGGTQIAVASSSAIDDGTAHVFLLQKTGNTASDLEIWESPTSDVSTVTVDETLSNPTDFEYQMGYFMDNFEGSLIGHLTADWSHILWFDDSLDEQQRQSVFNQYDWFSP